MHECTYVYMFVCIYVLYICLFAEPFVSLKMNQASKKRANAVQIFCKSLFQRQKATNWTQVGMCFYILMYNTYVNSDRITYPNEVGLKSNAEIFLRTIKPRKQILRSYSRTLCRLMQDASNFSWEILTYLVLPCFCWHSWFRLLTLLRWTHCSWIFGYVKVLVTFSVRRALNP